MYSQLRVALAMCGGIALTLYEAGVSHEIYRFYKAWEDYLLFQNGQAVNPLRISQADRTAN